MPLALRLTAATLFSCALVHCAPPREQPLASAPPDAPPGAVVGSPNPAMLALLLKARAK